MSDVAAPSTDLSDTPLRASMVRALDVELRGLAQLREKLVGPQGKSMIEAAGLIGAGTGRVIVTGMGKSGLIGRKIASTLASTGTPSAFIHPAEASHGDLGMISPGDIILALSWSGETSELSDIIMHSKRFAIPVVALTSNAGSTLGRSADVVIELPKVEEACPHGLAPTTSALVQLAVGDGLAIMLLERRGFTTSNFHTLHPGGKLGAKLKQLKDVMIKKDKIPTLQQDAKISDVLIRMSQGLIGCVFIVEKQGEKIKGIITDGDIRRRIQEIGFEGRAETLMSSHPIFVYEDEIVEHGLHVMSEAKVSVLPVLSRASNLVGAVHIQGIMTSGAI